MFALQAITQAPLLQRLPLAHPPRASSGPASLHCGWLVGLAQDVRPARHGPRPCVQETSALHCATHAPPLQMLSAPQPPRESSTPASRHSTELVGVAQNVAPLWQGA